MIQRSIRQNSLTQWLLMVVCKRARVKLKQGAVKQKNFKNLVCLAFFLEKIEPIIKIDRLFFVHSSNSSVVRCCRIFIIRNEIFRIRFKRDKSKKEIYLKEYKSTISHFGYETFLWLNECIQKKTSQGYGGNSFPFSDSLNRNQRCQHMILIVTIITVRLHLSSLFFVFVEHNLYA